ncbi:AtpZ/AtpI family protein [Paracoccaceae bacterium GXU_MW_L88]
MADPNKTDPLKDLDSRIKKAQGYKERTRVSKKRDTAEYTGAGFAWRMVIELTVAMVIGLTLGYGLDVIFGTLPIFLMIFGLFGFAAGIKTVMRSAREMQAQRDKAKGLNAGHAEDAPQDDNTPPTT